MDRMPSSSSLVSPLTSSTNHCILRMYGTPFARNAVMQTRRTTMATAVAAVHSKELEDIFATAHTASIGALMTVCMARPMNCWTWYTSLVDLVTRDATENESRSSRDHLSIRPNCRSLSVRHSADATRAARTDVATERTRLSRAQASMSAPQEATTAEPEPLWRWVVISDMYSGMRRSRYTWPTMRFTHRATIAQSLPRRYFRIMQAFPCLSTAGHRTRG